MNISRQSYNYPDGNLPEADTYKSYSVPFFPAYNQARSELYNFRAAKGLIILQGSAAKMQNKRIVSFCKSAKNILQEEPLHVNFKKAIFIAFLTMMTPFLSSGCSSGGGSGAAVSTTTKTETPSEQPAYVTVNSLRDTNTPYEGEITLRKALENLNDNGEVRFADELNGKTIDLSIIGNENSLLKAEVFTMNQGWQFDGYQERNYGASAIYLKKNVKINASALPDGITIRWAGKEKARIIACYGNIELNNITLTGGVSETEKLEENTQPWTLARGGAIAVWGKATLRNCKLIANRIIGDMEASRDRGAFGGGIYANIADLENCIIAGNTAEGYGVSGGGVFSVGGADSTAGTVSKINKCAVNSNIISGLHCYGGGIYSDGGGQGNLYRISIENTSIIDNTVTNHPQLQGSSTVQCYYRGGGVYMSNGTMTLNHVTIAGNSVTGPEYFYKGLSNIGGGAVMATIGNAHNVESMTVGSSIITGNHVNNTDDDLNTGSLNHFYSCGYNLIGVINFKMMLAPIPDTLSISRKHYPLEGDSHEITEAEVIDESKKLTYKNAELLKTLSTDEITVAYNPAGQAMDRVPPSYSVKHLMLQAKNKNLTAEETYFVPKAAADQLKTMGNMAEIDFDSIGDPSSVFFYGPPVIWPSNTQNSAWIKYWRDLDLLVENKMGPATLNDDFWRNVSNNGMFQARESTKKIIGPEVDQLNNQRPYGTKSDIGAVEYKP